MTVIYIILYELYFEEVDGNKLYLYHYAMNIGINLIKQILSYTNLCWYIQSMSINQKWSHDQKFLFWPSSPEFKHRKYGRILTISNTDLENCDITC